MTATNNEALAGDAAQRFEEHTQEISSPIVASSTPGDKSDDASGLAQCDDDHIGLDESDDRKGLARIRAELAKRGYAMLETSDGFLIGRWGWSKIAPDLRAVGAFLRQIGGAA